MPLISVTSFCSVCSLLHTDQTGVKGGAGALFCATFILMSKFHDDNRSLTIPAIAHWPTQVSSSSGHVTLQCFIGSANCSSQLQLSCVAGLITALSHHSTTPACGPSGWGCCSPPSSATCVYEAHVKLLRLRTTFCLCLQVKIHKLGRLLRCTFMATTC